MNKSCLYMIEDGNKSFCSELTRNEKGTFIGH